MGWAMLSKTLIQLFVDGRSCVPSLLFDLRPNYGDEGNEGMEVMKIMETSFKRSHAGPAALSAPNPKAGHHRPMPQLETPGHSQASLTQSLVGTLLLFSWLLVHTSFVCALQESVSPVLWKFCYQIPLASNVKFPGGSPG